MSFLIYFDFLADSIWRKEKGEERAKECLSGRGKENERDRKREENKIKEAVRERERERGKIKET